MGERTNLKVTLLRQPGLKISAEVNNGVVNEVCSEGPLSPFAKPALNLFKEFVCKEKPAFANKDYIVFSLFFPPIPSKTFSRAMWGEIKSELTKQRNPGAATIAVTRACACDCIYCGYMGSYDYANELTNKELKSIIDDVVQMGAFSVTIYGGDPILRKDVFDIIKYVKSKECWCVLFTPAATFTNDTAKKLKNAGLDAIFIVLHSRDSNIHDGLVQLKGAHSKAVNTIKACLNAGLLVGVSTYATTDRLNNGDIDDLIHFSEELGVHEITVADIIPTGKLLRREDVILTVKDRERLVQLEKTYSSPNSRTPRVSTTSCMKGPTGLGCIAGKRWVYVNPHGFVTPCAYIPLTFGNVRDETLQKIWKRIRKHKIFSTNVPSCLMQNSEFRKSYIQKIPEGVILPYPISKLESDD